MKKGIVTFCGHHDFGFYDICNEREGEKIFEQTILKLFDYFEYITFYFGGYGMFDGAALSKIDEMREEYNLPCETVYVTPYLSGFSDKCEDYDDTVYPPLESVPKRFCIPRRNNWMVEQADVLIAFVWKDWGGAWKMLDYAEHRRKTGGKPYIINLAKRKNAL